MLLPQLFLFFCCNIFKLLLCSKDSLFPPALHFPYHMSRFSHSNIYIFLSLDLHRTMVAAEIHISPLSKDIRIKQIWYITYNLQKLVIGNYSKIAKHIPKTIPEIS